MSQSKISCLYSYIFPSCCDDSAVNSGDEDEKTSKHKEDRKEKEIEINNSPQQIKPNGVSAIEIVTSIANDMTKVADSVKNITNMLDEHELLNTSDVTNSVKQSASEVCEIIFPNLINIAKQAAWIGPVAGALYDFYKIFEAVDANRESFQTLKKEIDEAKKWMNESKDLFMNAEDSFMQLLESPAKQFQDAVEAAIEEVKRSSSRLNDKKAANGNTLTSLALAKSDQTNLEALTSAVKTATREFQTSLTNVAALQQLKTQKKAELDIVCEYKHDSSIAMNASLLVESTRDWLFHEVNEWLAEGAKKRIFWLQATAGMGKTVFTTSLAERLRKENRLLAVHMFKFQDQTSSTAIHLCHTIARQIAQQDVTLWHKIVKAATELNSDQSRNEVTVVMNKLLIEILQEYTPACPSMAIVLDGLDEIGVEGSENRKAILELVIKMKDKLPAWVKIFVSGRPEKDIKTKKMSVYSHIIEENDPRHEEDLRKCVVHKLQGKVSNLKPFVDLLMKKSEGRFIYLAMITDEITNWLEEHEMENIEDEKELLSKESAFLAEITSKLPDGIYGCYEKSFKKLYAVFEQKTSYIKEVSVVKEFCAIMIATLKPLSVKFVCRLLGIAGNQNKIKALVDGVAMMFPARKDDSEKDCFYPLHKSVIDWLIDRDENADYFEDPIESHKLFLQLILQQVMQQAPQLSLINIDTACNCLAHKMKWYEWFGWKQSPNVPINFKLYDENATDGLSIQLMVYVVTFMCDHLDIADEYRQLSYQILTSLPFIQAAVEVHGVMWLRDQYMKRSVDAEWLTKKEQSVMMSLMRFCNLLLGANDPAEYYVSGCWSREICTQLVARLDAANNDDTSLYKQLAEEASSYIRQHGGILLKPGSFIGPNGACEAILKLPYPAKTIILLPKRNNSIAVATKNNIVIQNIITLQCEKVLEGHSDKVTSLCVFSDGRVISGSYDKTLRVWNVDSGLCEKVLADHMNVVTSVCVLSDGRAVSGSQDRSIRIWNVDSGLCEKVLECHTDIVTSVCLLSDGRVVSGSGDGTLLVWNVDSGLCEKVLDGHSREVTSLCMLSNGRVVSGSRDNTLRVWNVDNGLCEKLLEYQMWEVRSVCMLSDGRVISGSEDGTLGVWNVDSGLCEKVLEGHSKAISSLCLLSDGRVVSGSWDRTIRVWNVDSGLCEKVLDGYSKEVTSLCVLSDGRVVSGSWDRTVRVWNEDNGLCEKVLKGHSNIVTSLCVLSDGRLVSGSDDKTLRVWNVDSGLCEKVLEGHSEIVTSLCVLSDGRVVSGSWDVTLRVWNVDSGLCEKVLEGHSEGVISICLLLDGRLVSGSQDRTLRVWNVDSGLCEKVLEGHSNKVTSVCVLSDGRGVISGSEDKSLRVWNVDSGLCEKLLEGHSDWVTSVCVLSNGRVVSGSEDRTLRVWNLDSGLCEKLLENLVAWKLVLGSLTTWNGLFLKESCCFSDSLWLCVAFVRSSSSSSYSQCSKRYGIGCWNGRVLVADIYDNILFE